MAGTTGLEPATSAVTGQRSDQLSYVPRLFFNNLDLCHIESSVSWKSLISLVSTFSLLWTQFRALVDTKVDTKIATATTELSLSDRHVFWAHCADQTGQNLRKYCRYAGTPPAYLRGVKLPIGKSAEQSADSLMPAAANAT